MPTVLIKLILVLVVVLLAGCAGNQRTPVVGIVGPAPINQFTPPQAKGSLIVYSACESIASPGFPSSSDSLAVSDPSYTWEYTSYKILSSSGRFIKSVNNNDGKTVTHPRQIELPAGNYLVDAEADKYGRVTVPVVIAEGQNTILNLDNSGYWPRDARLSTTNAVCFPDGRVIGWRADAKAN